MTSKPDTIQVDPILAEHAAVIRTLGKRVIGDVIEIGRLLTEVKQIVGHGNWLPWLEREFAWTDETARRFMNVHELAGKSHSLLNLELPVSAIYALAAPSTPEAARVEIIERAANGEKLTTAQITQTIDTAKRKPAPAVAAAANHVAMRDNTDTPPTSSPGLTVTLKEDWSEGLIKFGSYLGVPVAEYVDFLLVLGLRSFNRKFQSGLTSTIEWWLIEMHSKYPDTFNYGSWEGSCGHLAIDKLYAARGIPLGKFQEWEAEQAAAKAAKTTGRRRRGKS
ncbi:DUF3102 domain-containing protein [Bradyrhizobium sp. McL0616]|uniref:DUF3102 domain-containing protein n=1 Tax=Bradyrhizobium sp. McL0616 TaxID=3415674 RepID=UPI003CEEB99A